MSEPSRGGLRGFERSLPMALMRAREAVMAEFRPLLTEHDLSEQQWRVLRALSDGAGPRSVGELADATFLLAPSLSRMLGTLERRGLVTRSVDPRDQRRSEIAVSPAGERLVAAIAPRSEARYRDIEQRFGRADLEDLYDLLGRMASLGADASS